MPTAQPATPSPTDSGTLPLDDILPLLRCPITNQPLQYDVDRQVLFCDSHEYPVTNQVLRLNPQPNDSELNAYYEDVNIRKFKGQEHYTEYDAFLFEGDYIEQYYRDSRRESLEQLVPEKLGTMLDIGGGGGELCRSLLRYTTQQPDRLILMDWAASQMQHIAPHLASPSRYFAQADAMNLPLQDNAVDTIFNSEMIEHLLPEQSQTMLNEFFRVLKPGGHLLITTPNGNEYRRLIQESMLWLLMTIKGENYRDLKSREKAKSRLLRPYMKVTGHHFVNVDAAEKASQIGHFNVLTCETLQQQLEEAGFIIRKTRLAIFIPLIAPRFFSRMKFFATLLSGTEKLARILHMTKLLLACQMYLVQKPEA